MFQVEVFRAVMPFSVVVGYQHFRGPYCWYCTTTLHGVVLSKVQGHFYLYLTFTSESSSSRETLANLNRIVLSGINYTLLPKQEHDSNLLPHLRAFWLFNRKLKLALRYSDHVKEPMNYTNTTVQEISHHVYIYQLRMVKFSITYDKNMFYFSTRGLRIVTSRSVVVGYQRFRGLCYLHFHSSGL